VEFTTLEVPAADGQLLKVGAYPGSGAKLAVLVLHGLYSHMGWYRPLAEALVERGGAVYLLDRRGAGLSGGLAGHIDSWRQIVDDLQRVVARIRSLHPGAPVCGLGISLGAAMTVATSLVHEDAFQRHALMSPGLAPAVQLPFMRRIGVVYSAFARPHVLYELPFTVEQLCEQGELRESLWSDPLRTRAITSRFLLEIFRMQRFVRQHIDRPQRDGTERKQREDDRLPPPGRHGHFTEILLANWAPKLLDGVRLLKNASPGCPPFGASPGRATASLHASGAPTRRTGSFSAKEKSTK